MNKNLLIPLQFVKPDGTFIAAYAAGQHDLPKWDVTPEPESGDPFAYASITPDRMLAIWMRPGDIDSLSNVYRNLLRSVAKGRRPHGRDTKVLQRMAQKLESAQMAIQMEIRTPFRPPLSDPATEVLAQDEPTAMFRLDAAGELVLWCYDDGADRMAKHSLQQMIGHSAEEVLHGQADLVADLKRCAKDQSVISRELPYYFFGHNEAPTMVRCTYRWMLPDAVMATLKIL